MRPTSQGGKPKPSPSKADNTRLKAQGHHVAQPGASTFLRHRLACVVTAVAILLAMVTAGTVWAVEPTDFTDRITGVEIKYSPDGYTWGDVPAEGVEKTGHLRFNIQWSLDRNYLDSNSAIQYRLPGEFRLVRADSGVVYNDRNADPMGTYEVSADGHIVIHYNETYVKTNRNSVLTGHLEFQANVSDMKTSTDERIHISIPPHSTEIPINRTSGMSIDKKAVEIDSANGIVKYTATVNSDKGTYGPVIVEDRMLSDSLTLDQGKGFTVTRNGGDISSIITPTATGKGFRLALERMDPGDRYEITYYGRITADAAGTDTTVVNQVKATSKRGNGDDFSVDKRVETNVSTRPDVSKSGGITAGGKTKWTIGIDTKNRDIVGWTLTDTPSANITLPDTVHISPAVNGSDTISVGGSGFTFPVNSTGDPATHKYTITYETDMPAVVDGTTRVDNTATLTPPGPGGDPGSGSAEVDYGQRVRDSLYKSGQGANELADGTAELKWAVSLKSPLEDSAGWTYTDRLEQPENGVHYISGSQWDMLVASVRQRLQWAGEPLKSQAESVRFTQDRDTAGRIVGFTIQSDGVFPQGGQLYFEYSSTGVTNAQAETVFRNQAGFNGATHTGENRLTPSHTSSEKYDLKSNITGDSGHDMSDLDTAVQNGGRVRYLGWKIVTKVAPKDRHADMRITELLPAGKVALLANADKPGLGFQVGDGAESEFGFDTSGNASVTVRGVRVTAARQSDGSIVITVPKELLEKLGNRDQDAISVYVRATLADGVLSGSGVRHATIENSVVVSGGDDGGILDRKTQRQTISDDRYKGMLSKSHPVSPDGHYAGNVITYSVVINPAGRKMLTDPNATLRLRDELTYTHNEYYSKLRISYVPGSAKLYEGVRDSSGKTVADESKPVGMDDFHYESVVADAAQGTMRNIITATVPDGKPLVLQYRYRFSGTENTWTGNVSNTVSLDGQGSTSDTLSFQIRKSSAGGDVSTIAVYKHDSRNYNKPLKGAMFRLYRYNGSTYEPVRDAHGGDRIFTTGADGQVDIDGKDIDYNTAYYLEEIKAPDGDYVLPTGQGARTYFIRPDGSGSAVSKPAGFTGRSVYLGDIIDIANTRAVALPSTGGMGDAWFIGGGVLTVLVASFGLAESLKNAKRSKVSQK